MASTTQTPGRIGSVFTLFLFALFFASGAAEAATREWVGASGGLWSAAANWDPVGTPADGDDLVFPAGTSAISVNDLAGTVTLRSLRFDDPHTIQGAVSTRVSDIIEVFADASIETPLQTTAPSFSINGTGTPAPTLNVSGALTVSGEISITGVVVNVTSTNTTATLITVNAGGIYVVGAIGALGPVGLPTIGLHLAGGTLRVDAGNSSHRRQPAHRQRHARFGEQRPLRVLQRPGRHGKRVHRHYHRQHGPVEVRPGHPDAQRPDHLRDDVRHRR